MKMTRSFISLGTVFFVCIAVCAVAYAEKDAGPDKIVCEIDTTIQSERIPADIYSQFIEHLGRSIYGGIWAEMLEDRKFYFPVALEYDPYKKLKDSRFPVVGASPWEIKEAAESVRMETENSYVGEHTPLIQADSGVVQHNLAIEKGDHYVGYIWLKSENALADVTVELTGARDPAEFTDVPASEYRKYEFSFQAEKETESASLKIDVAENSCFIGTVSLMPASNIEGMRSDTLALLKELGAPKYRWPGGNFVSGYDWRDGIGPRDRRPPRKNPAWTGIEHNDFGLDEFMQFCELVETEPVVVVNSGFGDAYSAAQEVEYCNGSTETIGGSWRAENGHPRPYDVNMWCIGNEMWGSFQLGYMELDQYVLKHNRFARKMRDVDPAIELIGVGKVDEWSEKMLRECADHMDEISEHFYTQDKSEVPAHVAQIPARIKGKADWHREYNKENEIPEDRQIPIAMDEWNYWYGPHEYGELGTRYFLKDALGIAAGVHEYSRSTDIIASAYYAQTVNVIGCVKTTKTDAGFAATGLALKMYRHQFLGNPVEIGTDPESAVDIAAAIQPDGETLAVAIVNPYEEAVEIDLELNGLKPGSQAVLYRLEGAEADPELYNVPGKDPDIVVRQRTVDFDNSIVAPPLTASIYHLK